MSPATPSLRMRLVPAAAGALALAALAAGAWYGFDAISEQPIRRVEVSGDLQRISRVDLDAFAHAVQGAAPSAASLAAIRDAARRIPWVRDAAVRRRFPDAVEVALEAHEPLARWAQGGLVSARGELFAAGYEGFLPRFAGPESAPAQMVREYPAIRDALAPLASAVTELKLSQRGAWQVVLESGLTLELGRGDIEPRLARFAAAWPQLASQGVEARHADLRYAKGFALQRAADVRPAAVPAPRNPSRREKKK